MSEIEILENNGIEFDNDAVLSTADGNMGLADFMGVDTSDVAEYEGGFSLMPVGTYKVRNTETKVSTTKRRQKDTNEEFTVPNIMMQYEVEEVISLKDPDIDASKLVGRKYTEFTAIPTFDSEQFAKAVGGLKAKAKRLGATDDQLKSIPAILAFIKDKSFTCKFYHRSYQNSKGETKEVDGIETKSIKLAD